MEYRSIVENYKQESYGIYDDTPDMHRAISISDAYYGDMSSLAALYIITGKPIVIQNTAVMCSVSNEKLFGNPSNPPDPDKIYIEEGIPRFITRDTSDVSYPLNENGIIEEQKKEFSVLTAYPDGTSGVHILIYVKQQFLS
jgi:hypothetical protein